MSIVGNIREGLRVRCATIDGLNAYRSMPETANLPAAIAMPTDAHIEQDFEGTSGRYFFDVLVIVPLNDLVRAQDQLDGYLSFGDPTCVFDAILADQTLGGACETLFVRGFTNHGEWKGETGGIKGLAAIVKVEVLT